MARLSIEDVSVDFGGIHALRDVTFELESGSIVGLIGPNGAGKSTLLNCVSGITRPSRGRVRLDEKVLSELPSASVAGCGIGRVFQHPELVADLSVQENLLIACHRSLGYGLVSELLKLPNMWKAERDAARRVEEVLGRLGLSDSAELTIRNLPYGHRKLVDLGRALLMDIRFLLLDEPIAGLNDAEVAKLRDLLLRLREELGLGILVVEHNMPFVSRLCDRLIVLDLGRLIANGAPADVLSAPKVMASYLGEDA
ncbi:branched-chain amino acid transport system ATP-binding protein [Bradyrhizobium sp. R2.2-H]|jgi:branched-chain amino acid transport system ATP-binding protein|uniref:ABC transporter ATP-binding protein n=1 Tax=unclassified Bradyrhizobium TaxID=2631580 RepID=UPI0010438346|nr:MULTISPECIES: ABC transporter ATP-binding protein [unclassified Bradyrhizobium]TCU73366.1 branched-chain amino acid transport system ATP-binding protein [Bradyrhizobium sp. Y-H1]TCU76445.1 branched-chain amino acid transport system ATP-binding protein [Bradyrhizobium sp. R2.2-H]